MAIPLYALAAERRQQLDALADLDLPEEALRDTLESIEGDLEQRAQDIMAYVRDLEGDAAKIKQAEEAMVARRKAIETRAARIRQYVLETMLANGIRQISCPWFVVSVAKSTPAVEIFDEQQIPADYLTDPPPPPKRIDKTLIAKAIKDGYDVPGAKLVQGHHLRIR